MEQLRSIELPEQHANPCAMLSSQLLRMNIKRLEPLQTARGLTHLHGNGREGKGGRRSTDVREEGGGGEERGGRGKRKGREGSWGGREGGWSEKPSKKKNKEAMSCHFCCVYQWDRSRK